MKKSKTQLSTYGFCTLQLNITITWEITSKL